MAAVERATASRELIFRAALKIFCARGDGAPSVSELALAAGVARGTVYNQLGDASNLFEQVAAALAAELHAALDHFLRDDDAPVERLARGLIFCLRKAAQDRDWGRFLARFGGSAAALREVWRGRPRDDLLRGLVEGAYAFRDDQIEAAIGLASGAAIMAIGAVVERGADWRVEGRDLAELILCALGVGRGEAGRAAARALAEVEAYRPL